MARTLGRQTLWPVRRETGLREPLCFTSKCMHRIIGTHVVVHFFLSNTQLVTQDLSAGTRVQYYSLSSNLEAVWTTAAPARHVRLRERGATPVAVH